MAESSGHAPLRIMDVRNVESLEDYNEHAADALPHNMEASNVAREALGLNCAAGNGADALEASLSESAGAFGISLGVLCTATVSRAHTHARTQKTSRTLALHSLRQWPWHRALLNASSTPRPRTLGMFAHQVIDVPSAH
jgi:hypothetical protein